MRFSDDEGWLLAFARRYTLESTYWLIGLGATIGGSARTGPGVAWRYGTASLRSNRAVPGGFGQICHYGFLGRNFCGRPMGIGFESRQLL